MTRKISTPSLTGEIIAEAPMRVELESVPTTDLRRQLDEAIGVTEAAIISVATIWAELTRRGENLSDIRFSLAPFMLPVARGQLLPGLVVAMSGQTRALQRVAELPVDDQTRLVNGDTVEIYRDDGRTERKSLADMTYSEIALTIRDGHIRTAAEQALAFKRTLAARPRKTPRGRPAKIVVLPDNVVRIGTIEITAERLIAELRSAGLI